MTQTQQSSPDGTSDAEIRNAISAFEQILSVMPTDIASLRAILNAYEELADRKPACQYLNRLGMALLDEGDMAAVSELLPKVEEYWAEGFQELDELLVALKEAVENTSTETAPSGTIESHPGPQMPPADAVSHRFDIEPELAFAWSLLEAGDLTQDEYSSVVQDLTEMSVGESAETVSVLHVLEARGFKNLERIIARVSEQCGAPVVALSGFLLQTDEYLLPFDFMMRRGTMIFDFVGDDALVVVMNPQDEKLRDDVRTVIGRTCHFFMVLPSDFDAALTRVSDVQAQAGAAPAE